MSLAAVIVITLTLVSNALFAEWSAPPNDPPASNVATPVHTGVTNQVKGGSIAAGEGRIGANQFVAYDKMRSEEYCDLNGENCVASSDFGTTSSTSTNSNTALLLESLDEDWPARIVCVLGDQIRVLDFTLIRTTYDPPIYVYESSTKSYGSGYRRVTYNGDTGAYSGQTNGVGDCKNKSIQDIIAAGKTLNF